MVPMYVNDWNAARLFFSEYDIPFEEITEGKNQGKLRVRDLSLEESRWIHEAEKRLRRSRLQAIIDHSEGFLDRSGNVVVTFNPYDVSSLPPRRPWLRWSEHSIYGYGTKTFVVVISREEIIAAEVKALESPIREAEERVVLAKRALDTETEKLAALLRERDRLKHGLTTEPFGGQRLR